MSCHRLFKTEFLKNTGVDLNRHMKYCFKMLQQLSIKIVQLVNINFNFLYTSDSWLNSEEMLDICK